MKISRRILLRMKHVSDIRCRGNQKTHFMFNDVFSKAVPFHEIMWKNMVQSDGPQLPNRIRGTIDAIYMSDN